MEDVGAQKGTKRPHEEEGAGGGEGAGFFIDKTGQDPTAPTKAHAPPGPKLATGPKYELPAGWTEIHHQWGMPFFVHEETGVMSVTRHLVSHQTHRKRALTLGAEDNKVTHSVVIEIDGKLYGQGSSNTKKKARQLAAMYTLEMLFPDMYKVDSQGEVTVVQKPWLEKYDRMDIRDPTLPDVYETDNLPHPFTLLQAYMSRYRRHEDPEVKISDVDPSSSEEAAEKYNSNYRFKFEMAYDGITVSGYTRSKKHARQSGSQLIMAALHPTLRFWGSVVRMYDQTRELFKDQSDEKDLGDLATRGNFDKPNVELLERLKTDMRRLYPNRPTEGPAPIPTSAGEILERHWLRDGETGVLPLGRYQPRMERLEERFVRDMEDVERREAQVLEEMSTEKKA